MLALKTAMLFLVGSVNLLIGFLVLMRDKRHLRNRLFFLFSLSLGGWVIGIGGFLLVDNRTAALIWAKIYYTFPLLIAATMPLFTRTFPIQENIPKWLLRFSLGGLALLVVPLILIPSFVTQGLVYHDWGKEIMLNKTHYFFYSGYLLLLFGNGLFHIYRKSIRLVKNERQQARTFFWGFILTSSLGVLFNLIYPWFGNYKMIWLGPLFTNAFIIATGYSIIKHKMFDIRFFVVRATAYALTTLILSVLYVAPALYVVANVIMGFQFVWYKFVVGVLVSTIAALNYERIRSWFNQSTRKFFFRDSYDAAAVIGELNNILVSTIDLNKLLHDTANLVALNLKADFCVFALRETTNAPQRVIGTSNKSSAVPDAHKMTNSLMSSHTTVIITEYLPDEDSKLKTLLAAHDIALLVRLTNNAADNEGELGFMYLGYKKSGNPYNRHDVRTLEIISNVVFLAIQNAVQFEEIQNFNITLQQQVEDATRQLRRTNAKLVALDESKDDFISMASHQLRTPLTSVKGYISMVLDGDAGPIQPMQRKMLNQAFMSSQRMVFLIADLLNVSRLKTGKFVIEPGSVNLANLVREEVGQLRETAASQSLELTYERPKDFPLLMLDETKTRQVVMNFIDNALHYTPPGGHIRVELRDLPHSVELRVIDDGIGVPKSEQHHLFTKFYRAGNARRTRPDGTGLGLFMAKKVVIAQGGAVVFDSRENHGSTFGFSLPKDKLLVHQTDSGASPAAVQEPAAATLT